MIRPISRAAEISLLNGRQKGLISPNPLPEARTPLSTAGPDQHIAVPLTINAALSAAKLWGAMITGSSALFAESVRSLTDVSSQALMLIGLSSSAVGRRAGNRSFWTFVVAILLYGLAAGIATYEGIDRLNRPRLVADARLAYAVLGGALVIQAALAWAAVRKPPVEEITIALRIEGVIGLLCAMVALAGMLTSDLGAVPAGDGIATIAIGALLAITAALMSLEVRMRLLVATPRELTAVAIAAPESAAVAPAASPPTPNSPLPAATPPHPHGTQKRKSKGKRRRR